MDARIQKLCIVGEYFSTNNSTNSVLDVSVGRLQCLLQGLGTSIGRQRITARSLHRRELLTLKWRQSNESTHIYSFTRIEDRFA